MVERSRRTATKPHKKVAHTIYTSTTNWNFAQSQDKGGASSYIHALLSDVRRKALRKMREKEVESLLRRISELEGEVSRLGGNPYSNDGVEETNEELQ